jgi:hypothetical protein
VHTWNLTAQTNITTIDRFQSGVAKIRFSQDGNYLASGISYAFEYGELPDDCDVPKPSVVITNISESQVKAKAKKRKRKT